MQKLYYSLYFGYPLKNENTHDSLISCRKLNFVVFFFLSCIMFVYVHDMVYASSIQQLLEVKPLLFPMKRSRAQ